MEIIEKVKETLMKYAMISRGERVLVSLSGGPDSVCLLSVLHKLKDVLGMQLFAAYIDHGLRPEEVPGEIKFCSALCSSLDVPFSSSPVDVKAHAKENRTNKQEAARELRYRALDEIALTVKADRIAVGHTADDQAETVLMRLFRGAGPSGLSGIPPVRNHIIRPLIEIERCEIEDFLKREGTGFVTDSSNLTGAYARNRIRQTVMPSIRAMERDVVKTISRAADIFRDEERYFDIQVTKTLMRMISRKTESSIELFIIPMETLDTVLVRRVLRRAIDSTRGLRGIGLVHIEDIIKLVKQGKSGDRIYLPRSIRVIKGYSTLLITAERPLRLGEYTIAGPGEVALKEASLVLRCMAIDAEEAEGDYGDGKRVAMVDADKARFPLLVRARATGDYFRPIGFGKRKKIQDFFVDQKIARDQRDTVPLLVHRDEIVWVAGHRIDERYKVDKDTARILKFEIKPLKF